MLLYMYLIYASDNAVWWKACMYAYINYLNKNHVHWWSTNINRYASYSVMSYYAPMQSYLARL